MILKNTDDKIISNKYEQSGIKAEKDMCFYLQRAYQTEDNIYVINDLRLKMEDDYAQIDHLIIHRFGFIIVESKSVTTKVCVNKYGEWKRIYNDKESGMPSPIQQAKRQADFLKKYLMQKDSSEIYRDNLVNKYLSTSIEKFGYDVLVAISDSGIIEREDIELDEICKADTITERVNNIIDRYTKQFSKILSINIPNQFHQDSLKKLSDLLVSEHCPFAKSKEAVKKEVKIVKEETPVVPTVKTINKGSCKKCKSTNVQIAYGKYGYYYKCQDCNGNSNISLSCRKSSCKPRLTKEKEKFYKVCKDCNTKELFFVNDLPK